MSYNSVSSERAKSGVSVYDCMDAFSQEEILRKSEAWYCSDCKKHQVATPSPYIHTHIRLNIHTYIHTHIRLMIRARVAIVTVQCMCSVPQRSLISGSYPMC
jgi:ubiquitin C-terminal hydrolase